MRNETRERIREQLLGDGAVRASISLRAYEIYERRGCAPGCELEDWLQAENEILPPLIEEGLHSGASAQTASGEAPAERPSTVEDKPAKKAARLFKRNRPASEQNA